MPDPREAISAAISADSVLQQKVTAINADLDAVPEKRHDAMAGCQ
ncbi:MAG: hypothetical protein ABSG23_15975 [Terriglobales bacterium]|jgi:hypothetical protein